MSGGFWKKAFGPVGGNLDEVEENEYYADEAQEYEEEEAYSNEYESPAFSEQRRSKIIEMPQDRWAAGESRQMKMIIFRPTSYDETQGIIDNLKARKPIVVNLDEIDVSVAQRILDFISGAVYALGGDIKKAARNIFVVVPNNFEVSTNIEMGSQTHSNAYSASDVL